MGINGDVGVKGVNVMFINGLGADEGTDAAVAGAAVAGAGADASCDGVNL